jgi:hypothetical protein
MKNLIPLLVLAGLLASCAPVTKNLPVIDEAQQHRITELESQLEVQRHRNDRWQLLTVATAIGGLVLLITGTALGAKTRHDAALS